jgi:ADP-ribosylglycohydrolase
MLGSLIGDIVGSAYEFSNFKGKDFAPLFHPKARFTDDTVCTVAVADALTRGSHPQATLNMCQQPTLVYASLTGLATRCT